MKLVRIPEDKYYDYRLQAMFDCYKWDLKFCDSNTLKLAFPKKILEQLHNMQTYDRTQNASYAILRR